MLKALELHGFKSFADKTRFEFPAGITVVVGPNGSGKSNVVDAIRWVLGEQSVKSLRGQEMADVVFKGNGEGGRKPMNSAEVTLTLDNSDRKLPIEADEVHVTRRIFRGGEGEYLINGQAVRLKDIRDLFRGTGVATDGYSLIEQGKVDRMLQSSAKDRRAMFEEAAGISRFKAKKVEALNRLSRVDQNLLRLKDIVDEVENRLKSVRAQASKARRYREHSDRLRELRTLSTAVHWREQSVAIEAVEREIVARRTLIATTSTELEQVEGELRALDAERDAADQSLRAAEHRLATLRELAHRRDDAADDARPRLAELQTETIRRGAAIALASHRAADARIRAADLEHKLEAAELDCRSADDAVAARQKEADEAAARFDRLRAQVDELRRQAMVHVKDAAAYGNEAGALVARQEALAAAAAVIQTERNRLADALLKNQQALDRTASELADLEAAALRAHEVREERDIDLEKKRLVLSERQEELAHLRGRHRGAVERTRLLEEWERRSEGVSAGARHVLEASKDSDGPWRHARGVVADAVRIDPQWAGALDLALGALDQAIVVAGDETRIEELSRHAESLPGPVVLIAAHGSERAEPTVDLSQQPGVLGRLLDRIETTDEFRNCIARLVGDVWLVESIAAAKPLRRLAPGTRFVTQDGRVWDASGALSIGGGRGGIGLVSRKAELRALKSDVPVFERQIAESTAEIGLLKGNIASIELETKRLADEHRDAANRASEARTAMHRARQERIAFDEQSTAANRRWEENTIERATAVRRGEELATLVAHAERAAADVERRAAELDRECRTADEHRREAIQSLTIARVESARAEQRRDAIRFQVSQCVEDEAQRRRVVDEERAAVAELAQRALAVELGILRAEQEATVHHGDKERALAETGERTKTIDSLRARREGSQARQHELGKVIRDAEAAASAAGLTLSELKQRRDTPAERLLEDYGIEPATLAALPIDPTTYNADATRDEMEALRRKINAIGSVNLDALDELDSLEQRHKALVEQYDDLESAKNSLERVIHRIDQESRRLFLETLEAVRLNFQTLYRRAFGGGKADLALEANVDVLDSGVEIVANPPGKSSFSNSLLSGGERALTAVALLLAIFQFRPSPFCVLDEVDAPFDEANIGRFVDVLKEFLGTTRFILVTHSKRTMTAANTLYGVTMQESGVSKRVSVRFEDVSEDGRISGDAVRREEEKEAGQRGVA